MKTVEKIKNKILHPNQPDLEELKDAPYFEPKLSHVKVVHITDGDTFHVIGNTFEEIGSVGYHKYVVRLRNIDTPEMHSKKPGEVAEATRSKQILSDLILDKVIELKDLGKDKYGRLLCNAFIGGVDVSKYLLDMHCGYEYHGGKKQEFVEKKSCN